MSEWVSESSERVTEIGKYIYNTVSVINSLVRW